MELLSQMSNFGIPQIKETSKDDNQKKKQTLNPTYDRYSPLTNLFLLVVRKLVLFHMKVEESNGNFVTQIHEKNKLCKFVEK